MGIFKYSDDNKRYHTLNYYNKHTYGGRVHKAAINAGFTCPNIDGTRGSGGCVYCSGGSGYFTAKGIVSVADQFNAEKARIREKYPDARITAYFQANTNTYASVERLYELYSEAIKAGADSISVGTRADCIDSEKVEMISRLPVPVTVELGLQTVHDATAELINRCHTYEEFLNGYNILRSYGIRVCVHIINGLPGENAEMMLDTAERLGKLHPDGVKIHLMHVISATRLAELYRSGCYRPMEKEEYIDIVVRQLELLPAETVIERLTGDGDRSTLIAPLWSIDKISVLGGIDKRMAQLDTWQGRLYREEHHA